MPKLREEACVEDIDFRHQRNLDRSVVQRLITCRFVKQHENIIFSGKTGLGKTWLACAFAHKACREGYSTLYVRIPRVLQEIFIAHGNGSYPKVMDRLSKPDVLVLDDFGLARLSCPIKSVSLRSDSNPIAKVIGITGICVLKDELNLFWDFSDKDKAGDFLKRWGTMALIYHSARSEFQAWEFRI